MIDAAALYRESGADGVVALGGGSPIDLGKATALMVKSDKPLLHYAGVARGKVGAMAPLVAVPTTAGTGSEVSSGFIVIVDDGRKLTFIADEFIPRLAICDPELYARPAAAPHGSDRHGCGLPCESRRCFRRRSTRRPMRSASMGSRERSGQGNLARAVADGSDREARWQMMMAATEGAMAFVKGLGAVHAMSHSAGRLPGLRLHHGTLNAVLLPVVLRFNKDAVPEKYARIAAAMGLAADADIAAAIETLNRRIGLPSSLGAWA